MFKWLKKVEKEGKWYHKYPFARYLPLELVLIADSFKDKNELEHYISSTLEGQKWIIKSHKINLATALRWVKNKRDIEKKVSSKSHYKYNWKTEKWEEMLTLKSLFTPCKPLPPQCTITW